MAESLYDELVAKFHHLSTEVVIDDRLEMSIGQRLHYARSSGYPHIVVLGKKVVEIMLSKYSEITKSKNRKHVCSRNLRQCTGNGRVLSLNHYGNSLCSPRSCMISFCTNLYEF